MLEYCWYTAPIKKWPQDTYNKSQHNHMQIGIQETRAEVGKQRFVLEYPSLSVTGTYVHENIPKWTENVFILRVGHERSFRLFVGVMADAVGLVTTVISLISSIHEAVQQVQT
jgi:hypothetical protein